jgi:hypothetical protein
MTVGKAVEGHRSPKPGGNSERLGVREASWSAPALWRFGRPELVGDDVRSLILKNPQSAIGNPKLK